MGATARIDNRTKQQALAFKKGKLVNMMKDEEKFFKELAKNPNLTAQQHAFLAEMATVRHYIHCHPEQIFWESKLHKKLSAYMGFVAYQENVNRLGIDFPYHICRQFALLPSYSFDDNFEPKTWEVNIVLFKEAADKFNEAFENYLRTIGQKYGVNYAPTGWKREEKNLSEDHTANKIYNSYFANGLKVVDDLTALQFETELRKELTDKYPVFGGHIDVRFNRVMIDENGHEIYNVFIKQADYDKFSELGVVDDLSFNGCRIKLSPVEATKQAVANELPTRKNLFLNNIERR